MTGESKNLVQTVHFVTRLILDMPVRDQAGLQILYITHGRYFQRAGTLHRPISLVQYPFH